MILFVILLIIKIISLFMAVALTVINTYQAMLKNDIDFGPLAFQIISITIFITLQWVI